MPWGVHFVGSARTTMEIMVLRRTLHGLLTCGPKLAAELGSTTALYKMGSCSLSLCSPFFALAEGIKASTCRQNAINGTQILLRLHSFRRQPVRQLRHPKRPAFTHEPYLPIPIPSHDHQVKLLRRDELCPRRRGRRSLRQLRQERQ